MQPVWLTADCSMPMERRQRMMIRALISVSKACCGRHRRTLRSCRSAAKHDRTVAVMCDRMATSESMYTPRSQTEETGNTSTVLIRTDWLVSDVDDGQTSTTGPRFLTGLPEDGWPSSTTAPRLHRQTFCRRGRRRHMVDTSHRSACRLRMHEEPAGGVLSATGDRRRTAGKGLDRGLILVEPHARLVMAARR